MKKFDVLDIKLNNRNAKFLYDLFDDVPDRLKELYDEKLYSFEKLSDSRHGLLNHILASDYISRIDQESVENNPKVFLETLLLLQSEIENSIIAINTFQVNYKFVAELKTNYHDFICENETILDKPVVIMKELTYINYDRGPVICVSQNSNMVADRHIIVKCATETENSNIGLYKFKG